MSRFRFLTAAFAGTFAYVLFSVFAGPEGIFAVRQLEEQKELLYDNLLEIQNQITEQPIRLTALTADSDGIAAYAKKLGYVSEGEKLIKLSGFTESNDYTLETGVPKKMGTIRFVPDWICKLTGLLMFGLCYIVLRFVPGERSRKIIYESEKRRSPVSQANCASPQKG